jgi:membrane-associated phospholipid phosphatase
MHVVAVPQRSLVRPGVAGPSMPAQLHMPDLPFPANVSDIGAPIDKLGAPPAPNSARAKQDMAITRALIAQRTPEGDAWARALDQHGATVVWNELTAQAKGDQAVAQSLVGAALLAASAQAGIGKKQWARQRPFQVDPTIDVVGRTPRKGDSSYPSAHAARAFAAARVLAVIDPTVAEAAYAMAREVACSRMYAGVHFASDVLAGARLGTAVADTILEQWRAGTLVLPAAPAVAAAPTAA